MIEPAVRRRGTRLLLLLVLAAGTVAAGTRPARAAGRPVRIEAIEIEGNTRTTASTVRRFLVAPVRQLTRCGSTHRE